MKTNFKNYLKKKKAQEVIDKYAKEYENKKIILYGVDLFTGDLFRNYDFSKLNIIGISDRIFPEENGKEYYGYKKFSVKDLLSEDFDLLLITAYDDTDIKSYLKKDLLKDQNVKFKIKTLIKMNLIEYIKGLMNGDF